MSKILSGKVKKVLPTEVSADRYNFLQLSEAEPDLGVPASSGYALVSADDGTRSWSDLSSLYVSVDGDTINGDLVVNGSINALDSVQFDLTAATVVDTGELAWNADEETLDLGLTNGVVLQVGQEVHYHVQNQSGATITDGRLVVASGTLGNSGKILIEEWDPATYPPVTIMGLTTESMGQGEQGYVTHFGKVRGIQTDGDNYGETWNDGDILYAGPNGGLTNVQPQAPNTKTIVALVIVAHPSNGTLFVRPTLSSSLGDDDKVELSSLADNQLLYYNAANQRFENTSTLETLTVDNVNIDGSNISGVGGTTIYLKNLGEPTISTDAATKNYVDTIASASLHYHDPVRVESPVALNATYDNGTSGVGATLTNAGTQAALVIDGVTLDLNDRVLIYVQSNAAHNGVYYVSNVGSASTNWVLTRTTDADSYGPSDPAALGTGDAFYVLEGDTGAGELYVMTTEGTITFGTTNITFSQISSAQIYSAGSGLVLNNTTFSHADTSSVVDLTATSRTYVTGLTFDTFGHVTGYSTGTETVSNIDTTYALSTEVGDDIYSEKIRLSGTDASEDDIILAVGSVDTTYGLTIEESNDTITFKHADTSSVGDLSSGNSNGVVLQDLSLTFDTYGHVTGATASTVDLDSRYDNYGSWSAVDGDGTTYTITSQDTLTFAEGSGIDVNFTADDVLTFTNTDLGSAQDIFKSFVVTDTDSGYTWADTGTVNAGSNTDTLTFVSGTNVEIDVDPTSKAVRITSTLTGEDNYVDSVDFNSVTGVLTLGRTGALADLTVELDGRYSTTDTNTTYALDGSGTTNSVDLELVGSNSIIDSINFVGTGGTTVSWDEGNQRITIDSVSTQNLFNQFTITDTDSGFTWSGTGSFTADNSTDTVTFVSGTNVNIDIDSGNDAVRISSTDTDTTYSVKASIQTGGAGLDLDAGGSGSGTDTVKFIGAGAATVTRVDADTIQISTTDTNTDNYVDSVAFNTGTGVLTLGRTGALADLTVDLDGRYDNYVSWTARDGNSTTYTITSGDTLQFAEGTGMDVAFTADDVLTFTNTDRGSSQTIFKTFAVTDTDSGYTWADTGNVVADTNNDTVTFVSGSVVDIDVDSTNDGIRIAHRDVARSNTTSSASPGYGGTFNVVDSITTSAQGHITAVNVKTVTMPSVDDTNTTYNISTEAGANAYSEKIRLTGSDASTDEIILAVGQTGTTYGLTIAESGDTITFAHADTSSQASVNNSGNTFIQDITLDEFGHITGITSAAASDTTVTITNDTTTSATYYPTFSTTTSGTMTGIRTSNTKLTFNPSTGDLGATNFNSLSDETKKKDIETIVNAVELLLQLRGVTFKWKETNKSSIGLIAQEVENVLPEVVVTLEDGTKTVSYGNIVGLLIEGFKNHEQRINTLEQLLKV